MRSRSSCLAAVGSGLAVVLFLGGCAAVGTRLGAPSGDRPAAEADDPFKDLADLNRAEARRLQEGGLPRQAVDRWRVVAALSPKDVEARRRVAALEKELAAAAESHFERGRSLLEGGNVKAARRELLRALEADPEHVKSLDYLKNRLEPKVDTYVVEEGDTLENIAERRYGSPAFAAVLARLNGIGAESRPLPGRPLLLPLLGDEIFEKTEGAPAAEVKDAKSSDPAAEAERAEDYVVRSEAPPEDMDLALARDHFEAGEYEEAINIALMVPPDGSQGEKARDLVNSSYLGYGRELFREKRYREALDILGNAEPASEDVKKLISEIDQSLRKEAEEHYLAGIRLYIEQQLEEAIVEWEKTLALYPDHPKARKDLDKALKLSEQLQQIH